MTIDDFTKYASLVLLNVQKAFQTSSWVGPLVCVGIGFRALSERERGFVNVLKSHM